MRSFRIKINGNLYEAEIEETTPAPGALPHFNTAGGQPAAGAAADAAANAPAAVNAAPVATAPPPPAAAVAPPPATPAPVATGAPAAAPAGGAAMQSPLPGTVLKLVLAEGSAVKAGEVAILLEAMKMENEICAPASGVIRFKVAQGDAVNTNDLLFTVE